jgi:hypothetical protein
MGLTRIAAWIAKYVAHSNTVRLADPAEMLHRKLLTDR